MEYQGVYTDTNSQVFHKKIDGIGTNNCGEFLAIVHALAWQKEQNCNIPIYSDSDVAIGWVKQKKCKTTLERTADTAPIFHLIERAEAWLNENPIRCDLLKWLTKDWGEIPADFAEKVSFMLKYGKSMKLNKKEAFCILIQMKNTILSLVKC